MNPANGNIAIGTWDDAKDYYVVVNHMIVGPPPMTFSWAIPLAEVDTFADTFAAGIKRAAQHLRRKKSGLITVEDDPQHNVVRLRPDNANRTSR